MTVLDAGPAAGPRGARLRAILERMPLWLALAGLVLLLSAAVLAPLLTGTQPQSLSPAERFRPPGQAHPFGTDAFGRDLFTIVLRGSATAVTVGGLTVLAALVPALMMVFAGRIDPGLDRLTGFLARAALYCPGMVVAIILAGAFGRGILSEVAALGVMLLPRSLAGIRDAIDAAGSPARIDGARALGLSRRRILERCVLPSVWASLASRAAFLFAASVAGESALSFLGVGIGPGEASWGAALGEARLSIQHGWWLSFFPGLALILATLAGLLAGHALEPRSHVAPRR